MGLPFKSSVLWFPLELIRFEVFYAVRINKNLMLPDGTANSYILIYHQVYLLFVTKGILVCVVQGFVRFVGILTSGRENLFSVRMLFGHNISYLRDSILVIFNFEVLG